MPDADQAILRIAWLVIGSVLGNGGPASAVALALLVAFEAQADSLTNDLDLIQGHE